MIYILGATRLKKDVPQIHAMTQLYSKYHRDSQKQQTTPTAFLEDILYLLSLCCQHCSFSQLKELSCGLPQGKLLNMIQHYKLFTLTERFCVHVVRKQHIGSVHMSRRSARCRIIPCGASNGRCSGSKFKSRPLTEWRSLLCQWVCWWTNQKSEQKCVILCAFQVSRIS